MRFSVLTLFPKMLEDALSYSILGRAKEKGLMDFTLVNIRDFSHGNYQVVDDYPYGGGPGMVMQAPVVYDAYESLLTHHHVPKSAPVIYLSPKGKPLTSALCRELSAMEEVVLLCGHYEGIDERVLEEIVTMEVSIGDYVLTGGELPALVLMDAVSRFVPGVLGNEASSEDESFSGNLLEYPQYTRPRVFRGREVPEVLLSGNHAAIDRWRREMALEETKRKRPDLLEKADHHLPNGARDASGEAPGEKN